MQPYISLKLSQLEYVFPLFSRMEMQRTGRQQNMDMCEALLIWPSSQLYFILETQLTISNLMFGFTVLGQWLVHLAKKIRLKYLSPLILSDGHMEILLNLTKYTNTQ